MEAKYDFTRKYREQIQRCSRCGFCQAVCPAYGSTLRPAYNARGKMLLLKEILDGKLELTEELIETLYLCTTCAACAHNCPSGVQVPEIIKAVRRDMVKIGTCHPAFEGMNEVLDNFGNIYAEEEQGDFDKERGGKADFCFFIGCVGQYREEDATEAVLELFDRLDVNYAIIDEVCCSGVLEDVGYDMKPKLVEKNIELIKATGAKTLVTGCPYCFRTFTGKPLYQPLRDSGMEILHISQFLPRLDINVKTDKKVTYHDPCDLGRHTGIYEEPRATIKKIAENFVELPSNHAGALCCGAGGGVRGAFAKNSLAMARRRLQEVEEVGADIVLTECNSCVHNLANAKLRAQKFKIYTTTQFINELMDEAE